MTSLRGPAWGVTEDPETPPAVPYRLRATVIIGAYLTGTATGIAVGALILTATGATP